MVAREGLHAAAHIAQPTIAVIDGPALGAGSFRRRNIELGGIVQPGGVRFDLPRVDTWADAGSTFAAKKLRRPRQ